MSRAEYFREYYKKNKEKVLHKNNKWKNKNKDISAQISKEWRQAQKNGYHNVYLLPKDNYVGCTENLKERMYYHKSIGRDTNYKILFQSLDRDEALQMEAQYHEQGYEGKHANNMYQ